MTFQVIWLLAASFLGFRCLSAIMKHLPTCVLSFFVAGFCQETWQSRILYQWKNVSSPLASPKERIQSELLVDSNRGHVYLIGGTNSGPLSMGRELWRYNIKLSLWASIVPPAPTPSFRLHASTIDLKRDVFYVFGGISGPGKFWFLFRCSELSLTPYYLHCRCE